jgi:hypothetical protein
MGEKLGDESGKGGGVKKRGLEEGLGKSKEWVPLLGWDLRGRRQKGVGTLKGEVDSQWEVFLV